MLCPAMQYRFKCSAAHLRHVFAGWQAEVYPASDYNKGMDMFRSCKQLKDESKGDDAGSAGFRYRSVDTGRFPLGIQLLLSCLACCAMLTYGILSAEAVFCTHDRCNVLLCAATGRVTLMNFATALTDFIAGSHYLTIYRRVAYGHLIRRWLSLVYNHLIYIYERMEL